jgi:hypothetical protein
MCSLIGNSAAEKVRSKTIHETSIRSTLNAEETRILPHRNLTAKEDFLEIAMWMFSSRVSPPVLSQFEIGVAK